MLQQTLNFKKLCIWSSYTLRIKDSSLKKIWKRVPNPLLSAIPQEQRFFLEKSSKFSLTERQCMPAAGKPTCYSLAQQRESKKTVFTNAKTAILLELIIKKI